METLNLILLDDVQANQDSWLDIKSKSIGSSEIATVAGLNSRQTPLNLWLEKTGQIERSQETMAMRMGKIKEPIIAEIYSKDYGVKIHQNRKSWGLQEYPWAMATPDYVYEYEEIINGKPVSRFGILEIKNTNSYAKKDWEDNNIPNYAHLQTIWQMGITGVHKARIVALIGDSEIVVREVEFDEGVFQSLLALAQAFMQNVKDRTPPSVTAEDLKQIQKMFEPKDEIVEFTEKEAHLVGEWLYADEQYQAARKVTETWEKQKKLVQAKIELIMAGATTALYNQATITSKTSPVKESYRPASTMHRFNIKVAKENMTDSVEFN